MIGPSGGCKSFMDSKACSAKARACEAAKRPAGARPESQNPQKRGGGGSRIPDRAYTMSPRQIFSSFDLMTFGQVVTIDQVTVAFTAVALNPLCLSRLTASPPGESLDRSLLFGVFEAYPVAGCAMGAVKVGKAPFSEYVRSSTGRVADSKSVGCGFDSYRACQS